MCTMLDINDRRPRPSTSSILAQPLTVLDVTPTILEDNDDRRQHRST